MGDQPPHLQDVRSLRDKAVELEHLDGTIEQAVAVLAAGIALVARLLADHMERSPGPWGPEPEEWSNHG